MTTAVREAPHHNKLTCYTDYKCRLPQCVERYRAWDRDRRRAKANGAPSRFIDAEPVRQHLLKLLAAGFDLDAIASAAGLSYLAVRSFIRHEYGNARPRRRRCTPATAAKILAVTADSISTGRIDATGTRRRLQALAAIGWPLERIAPHAQLSVNNMSQLMQRERVYASTARNVAAAYDLLRNQKPARHGVDRRIITRTKNRAAARRWAPPGYWDDRMDVIDDPDFEPLYGVTRRELVAQDANEVMRFAGLDRQAAAERLGVHKSYLDHAFREYPQYAVEVAA